MTRLEAIEWIDEMINHYEKLPNGENPISALNIAKTAITYQDSHELSEFPEYVGGKTTYTYITNDGHPFTPDSNIVPLTPLGKWIDFGYNRYYDIDGNVVLTANVFRCNRCNYKSHQKTKFCPGCGNRMDTDTIYTKPDIDSSTKSKLEKLWKQCGGNLSTWLSDGLTDAEIREVIEDGKRQIQVLKEKHCANCKYNPPERKWPCVDCSMQDGYDRWESSEDNNIYNEELKNFLWVKGNNDLEYIALLQKAYVEESLLHSKAKRTIHNIELKSKNLVHKNDVIEMLNKIDQAVYDGEGYQYDTWVEYANDLPVLKDEMETWESENKK